MMQYIFFTFIINQINSIALSLSYSLVPLQLTERERTLFTQAWTPQQRAKGKTNECLTLLVGKVQKTRITRRTKKERRTSFLFTSSRCSIHSGDHCRPGTEIAVARFSKGSIKGNKAGRHKPEKGETHHENKIDHLTQGFSLLIHGDDGDHAESG